MKPNQLPFLVFSSTLQFFRIGHFSLSALSWWLTSMLERWQFSFLLLQWWYNCCTIFRITRINSDTEFLNFSPFLFLSFLLNWIICWLVAQCEIRISILLINLLYKQMKNTCALGRVHDRTETVISTGEGRSFLPIRSFVATLLLPLPLHTYEAAPHALFVRLPTNESMTHQQREKTTPTTPPPNKLNSKQNRKFVYVLFGCLAVPYG